MSAELIGRAASPGAAVGRAFVVVPRRVVAVPEEADDPAVERRRADGALAQVGADLERLADQVGADTGAQHGEIFLAHADFVADPELAERVRAAVDRGASAEHAVRISFDSFRGLLEQSDSEYLAARAADLDDVRDQVLDVLAGGGQSTVPVEPCVVVAEELTPSQTARIPREHLRAIACAKGSPTSHAAILARSLGIPAVVGVTGLLDAVVAGDTVVVDGEAGRVLVGPDDDEQAAVEQQAVRHAAQAEKARAAAAEPCATLDGHRVEVAANIDGPAALERAIAHGAEGSGLVRTELLFLGATASPSIEEQATYYHRVLATFPGQRVVFRTMDIGADKPVPYIDRADEDNPALGLRGVRLGLARPELLRDQLRALLRARAPDQAQGNLAIMFPLVSHRDEIVKARALLEEAVTAEGASLDGVEVGVMIEVPSAALAARRIARHVDFVSLGTNDLLQYLFAVDRTNADVAELAQILDPDVLRLVCDVATAAHEAGAWVGVCGEAAADPLTAAALVGAGADELSATPTAIPQVKAFLRQLRRDDLRATVEAALTLDDADAVRERLEAATQT